MWEGATVSSSDVASGQAHAEGEKEVGGEK